MTDRLVDATNVPCGCVQSMSAEFDYKSPVPIDRLSELHVDECVRPSHGMTGSRFEFTIEPNEDTFVHLSTLTLHAKLKVQSANGTNLTALSHKPAFVNNIIASLWSSVVVKINGHELNPLSAHHPGYKAMIANLLSYNPDGARQLAPGGFQVEDGEHNETLDDNYKQFQYWTVNLKQSTLVDISGPLPLDICSLDNMLAPGVKLEIVLEPSPEAFHLMCSHETAMFKTTFQDMFLQFRRVRMTPQFTNEVLASSRKVEHRYIGPYTHLSSYEVPKGSTMHVVPLYPTGHVLPKHLVVAQVPTKNFRGTLGTNPYVFPHYDLVHLAVRSNNVVAVDSELTPDFANHLVAREYFRLCTQTGKRGSTSEGTLITEDNFVKNHTLFPFDLTPDECNARHLHLSRTAKLDLEMRWKKALEDNVTVLVLATFDQIITIHPKSRAATSHLI